ncbi:Plasmodium exported protein, unknown function [Plasmodium malariae]|uniref:PIR Superfamily Protein n=1 Tax=Plasmodium malariae TaxID=5858 RepID=A0A1D3SMG1_PLAMA|nr:Plasmodium exported protein, unknown function [Plasmodium malariae]SCO92885.1 Plasmodium exported protein, unknown function [Plasmodium malariae]
MKDNSKSINFINILVFTIFVWICYYSDNTINCDKSLDGMYELGGNLFLITNRLLVEGSMNKKSTKDVYGKWEKNKLLGKEKYKSNNYDHRSKSKNLKESLLDTEKGAKIAKGKQTSLLKRIDIYFEKKLFNLLDSIYKIKNNNKISKNTAYIKIFQKICLAVTPPFLLLLTGLVVVLVLCVLFVWGVYLMNNGSDNMVLFLSFFVAIVLYSLFLICVTFFIVFSIICASKIILRYNNMKKNNSKICYK